MCYLNVGDKVRSDSFLTEKEMEEIGPELNIPPFVRPNRQMPHADIEMTQKLPSAEFMLREQLLKLKVRSISGIIPISCLGNINQIWYVVSMFSNFQPHVIRD